jgi:hypothetical protein
MLHDLDQVISHASIPQRRGNAAGTALAAALCLQAKGQLWLVAFIHE